MPVAGFRVLGVSGFDLKVGAICSVLSLPSAVDVRAEVGGAGVATIPYTEMTGLKINDATTTRGGGFVGGGFGLTGAAEGIALASVLNSVTRKTVLRTRLAIASTRGELLLNHDRPYREVREKLSPLLTRFDGARRSAPTAVASDDAMSQLERLAQLREKGLLTAEEYEAARSRRVRRLTEPSG